MDAFTPVVRAKAAISSRRLATRKSSASGAQEATDLTPTLILRKRRHNGLPKKRVVTLVQIDSGCRVAVIQTPESEELPNSRQGLHEKWLLAQSTNGALFLERPGTFGQNHV
jgi:hypothetical protein